MTQADAEAAIKRAGFERAPTPDVNPCSQTETDKEGKLHVVEIGHVCRQSPSPGPHDSTVPITIAVQTKSPWSGDLGNGRHWILFPDLVGTKVDRARALLKEKGFTGPVNTADDDAPSGGCGKRCEPDVVCCTSPSGLTTHDQSGAVLLYVGHAR